MSLHPGLQPLQAGVRFSVTAAYNKKGESFRLLLLSQFNLNLFYDSVSKDTTLKSQSQVFPDLFLEKLIKEQNLIINGVIPILSIMCSRTSNKIMIDLSSVDCDLHRQMALDITRKSMVLLHNNGILPLAKTYGIVEFSGEVRKVDPSKIRFKDETNEQCRSFNDEKTSENL